MTGSTSWAGWCEHAQGRLVVNGLLEADGGDLLGGRGCLVPVPTTDQDIGPGRGKPGCHRLAQALGTARDDRRAAT